jgi:hypothetical protein
MELTDLAQTVVHRVLALQERAEHLTVQSFGSSLHSTSIPLNIRVCTGMLPWRTTSTLHCSRRA